MSIYKPFQKSIFHKLHNYIVLPSSGSSSSFARATKTQDSLCPPSSCIVVSSFDLQRHYLPLIQTLYRQIYSWNLHFQLGIQGCARSSTSRKDGEDPPVILLGTGVFLRDCRFVGTITLSDSSFSNDSWSSSSSHSWKTGWIYALWR